MSLTEGRPSVEGRGHRELCESNSRSPKPLRPLVLDHLVRDQVDVWMQSWNFVWSYLGGALISEWVLRLPHGVTGRGAAAWPHSRPAVSIFGGQAATLPIVVLLSAEERQRQIVARSCSRRWRVLWGPRPSATVLTPGGACDLGRAAEQYEEPSNHGFTLSRPDGSREKRRQPARWGWYVGEPNVLFPAQPAL